MAPHLVRWHEQYAKKGLVIIDVDNGARDSLEKVKGHVEEAKIPHVVLHDVDGQNCKTYGIRGFPSAFLIDVDGKVVWQGFPGAEVEDLPGIIEPELAKVKLPAEGEDEKSPEPPKEDPPKDEDSKK